VSQPAADDTLGLVLLYRGSAKTGEPLYAYLAIHAEALGRLLEANQSGQWFDITSFGTILAWGYGTEPDADTRMRMERDYGYSHTGEIDLTGAPDAMG
jgi:hypothetical protein